MKKNILLSIASCTTAFLLSLISAVLVLIAMYHAAFKNIKLAVKWFWGWMCCLTLGISLQLFGYLKLGKK